MADNLPLIPGKKESVCTDVKPVLREVFREMDHLPPLALESTSATDEEKLWIKKYNSECEEIWHQEEDLKEEFAKRISKMQARNVYRLSEPTTGHGEVKKGLIGRQDLMPGIEQNAAGDQTIWIQNLLNKSSCNFSYEEKTIEKLQQPLRPVGLDECSRQTYSIGELELRKPPLPPREIPPPAPPGHLYCVPHEVKFVNFGLDENPEQEIRIVNLSKLEIRLSITVPRRHELGVELSDQRCLRVTAGSYTKLKVTFHPIDARTFDDELGIRTSMGQEIVIPIACYMEPPQLYIYVHQTDKPIVTFSNNLPEKAAKQGDLIDLGARLLGDEHHAALVFQSSAQHASFFVLTEDAWVDWTVEELTADGSLKTGSFTIHPAWWAGGGVIKASVSCLAPHIGFHKTYLRILELTSDGSLKTGPFTIHPAWWAGGGVIHATITCLAPHTGFHKTYLRILSSTAVTRVLHVVADSLYYSPKHIEIQAHEKDYDINSEDDPDCEYYVNLGTAFANRSLSAVVKIHNYSPMAYSFYWKFRPWGECSCWQDYRASAAMMEQEEELTEDLCPGAKLAKEAGEQNANDSEANYRRVRLEPAEDVVRERGSCAVRVCVPDVGACLGTHRAVLLLVLKDIPLDSFRPNYMPNTVCMRTVEEQRPGGKTWTRTVCDIVQAQMEVWWNVVSVRFALDPPIVSLTYSRRVKAVKIPFNATLLHGPENVLTKWHSSAPVVLPMGLNLSPLHSIAAKMPLLLPSLPNEYPETDVITLRTETEEWAARCHITCACATRHPSLTPARIWLGVVPPGAKVFTNLDVTNNTHQDICWWATPYRWVGENAPFEACAASARTCGLCQEHECTCSMIYPSRGALAHEQRQTVRYDVYAPTTDRCVVTLLQVARTSPDTARVPGSAGTNSRASLLMYRVLAPRLVLRVFACGGNKKEECRDCSLDPGENESSQGSHVLRPSRALTPCCCTCYKLRIINITPIPTTVRWEDPVDGEEFLKVKFYPKEFNIAGYAEKIISVILVPRKVCGRRLFVLRAQVRHAYKPLYLIIDTAIDGVKIICELPLGGMERNDSFVKLRGSQKEAHPWDTPKPTTPSEWFVEEDRKRDSVRENANRCDCRYEMIYIPPKKPLPSRESEDESPSPEIVTTPPTLTRVCECFGKTKPVLPEYEEPFCLQFRDVPIRTVRTRMLMLRNVGQMTARWRVVVRRWPRQNNRAAAREAMMAGKDLWAVDIREPGVAIQCSPAQGVCVAGQSAEILVMVYADTWGLYYDQIMLMVDLVDPIVIDVWIEAVGSPLQFSRIVTEETKIQPDFDATMWLSASDPVRTLRVKNSSRSLLTVHAYTLLEHEHSQDARLFRLYTRFLDILPLVCPCSTYVASDVFNGSDVVPDSSVTEEMDTDIELYLAADYGLQDNQYYKVEPQVCSVAPGDWMEWRVTLKPGPGGEQVPPGLVLLRIIPEDNKGDYWHRPEPLPRRVGVRTAPRASALRLSCGEMRAHLCALDLQYNEVARVRKRFRMRNIGTAPLNVHCSTAAPWQIVTEKPRNDCDHCNCKHEIGERHDEVEILLEPWSSVAMCVEVSVNTEEMWPKVENDGDGDVNKKCELSSYPPRREVTGQITFDSDEGRLETLPLILEVDFPRLSLEPDAIDFGFVTDGDTRKTYFSVWHSSLSATIDLGVSWDGSAKLRLYPRHLRVPPGERVRIYLQYTAKWMGAPVPMEGCVRVSAVAGAGTWCRCALYVRAQPSRDTKFLQERHDHTDQWNLLPPDLPQ